MTLSLTAQRDRLTARIEADRAKLAAVNEKIARRGRRRRQRLKVIAGTAMLPCLYKDEESRVKWHEHLDNVLTRPHDRAVFLARYPQVADPDLLAAAQEQASASAEIAKLDWRLALLVGAAGLNQARENSDWRKQLRALMDQSVTGKRDRSIVAELYAPATEPKG